MKLPIFIGLVTLCFVVKAFDVYPRTNPVTVVEEDDVSFHYVITPWPPPYHDVTEDSAYEHVTLTFLSTVQSGVPVPLCEVVYVKGVYDETTGNCTLWNERMLPFDPIPTTGVYFSFIEANYTTDLGDYVLRIEYGYPMIESPTTLEILVPVPAPSITATPPGEVEVGTKVMLDCRVNNALPGAALRWTRGQWEEVVVDTDGPDYHEAEHFEEYSFSRINLKALQSDHGIAYVCHANNGLDELSASVALNILFDPDVRLEPCNIDGSTKYTVVEGDNAKFDCIISANPDVHDIAWQQTIGESRLDNFNGTRYTVIEVSRDQEGVVMCIGESTRASSQSSCELQVQYAPDVSIPDIKELDVGDSMSVTCTSEAKPTAEHYEWMRADYPEFHVEGQLLTLSDIQREDAGIYMCQAYNTLNPTNREEYRAYGIKEMHVHVKFAPEEIEYTLTKFTGLLGMPVELECKVYAYPYVDIEWRRNSQVIIPNEERNITQEENTGYLHIKSVAESDFGDYECRVSNELGFIYQTISLLLPGKPDAPQHCDVQEVTDSDVTLLCVPGYDGGESVESYVEVESNGDRRYTDSFLSMTSNGYINIRVWNIQPSTNYDMYVFAKNIHGVSDGSILVQTRTADGNGSGIASSDSSNVGLIIGCTIALLVLLAALVGVVLVVLWKYRVEPSCAKEARERSGLFYESLPNRSSAFIEHQAAYENSCFKNDATEAYTPEGNEYTATPGMLKQQHTNKTHQSQEDMCYANNRSNEAYEQRNSQNYLAGNGALSHGSKDNLNQSTTAKPNPYSGAMPRKRPAPIGGAEEEQKTSWEIPREKVTLKQKLDIIVGSYDLSSKGEGAFGEVWYGKAHNILGRNGSTMVAVKFVDEHAALEEKRTLLTELRLMQSLDSQHPNVIQLYGCCTVQEPVYIIMEYASNGNLQQFLRNNRSSRSVPNLHNVSKTLSSRDLAIFSLHVASGMEFISSKRYLHRDLAARNVLVDHTLTCKIGDFGLARDIINCRQYESSTTRKLPIRWMAPESLFDSIYTSKSDVWAFGVLLWETVTLGATPYPGMSGPELAELIQQGYRMEKPKYCSNDMYQLMLDCWAHEPNMRPGFTGVRQNLERILYNLDQNMDQHISVAQMQENMLGGIVRGAPGEKC